MEQVVGARSGGLRIRDFTLGRQFWLVLINLFVIAVLTIAGPEIFLSWINSKALLSLMFYDLLLATSIAIVLVVSGLDLSVGAVLVLTSVMLAILLCYGTPIPLVIEISFVVAIFFGGIDGLLIVKVRLLPFLATLAMMMTARGVAILQQGDAAIQAVMSPPKL